MRKHLPQIKLSRQKGVRPKTSQLDFGQVAWNIADGTLYAKILNAEGDEEIIVIAGNEFSDNIQQEVSSHLNLSEQIISLVNIGAVKPGDVFLEGLCLTEFAKQLLIQTFYPKFTSPSATLTINAPLEIEAGFYNDFTLTVEFDRGAITGDMVSGLWDDEAFQDHRAGNATNYFISDIDLEDDNLLDIGLLQVGDDEIVFHGSVHFLQGPLPLSSKGEPCELPLPAGVLHCSASMQGQRKMFFGHSSPADSSQAIRSLQSSLFSPQAGTEFTISAPQGATSIVIAYPASLGDLSSVVHLEGAMSQIVHQFTQSLVSVSGLNGYNPIAYKVFILTPATALFAPATFKCKI